MRSIFTIILAMFASVAQAQTVTTLAQTDCGYYGFCGSVANTAQDPIVFAHGLNGAPSTVYIGTIPHNGATVLKKQLTYASWQYETTFEGAVSGVVHVTYQLTGCRIVGGRPTSCVGKKYTLTDGTLTY